MSPASLQQRVGEAAALMAALNTGLLELLATEALSPSELAPRLGLDCGAVSRLLELLESGSLLSLNEGRYQLLPGLREGLEREAPSLASLAKLWAGLDDHLHTGAASMIGPTAESRGPVYASVVARLARLFEVGAGALATQVSRASRSVLDVGAGAGVWSLAMAQHNPDLQVIAVDRPEVLPRLMERARALGLHDRVTSVAADYHQLDFSAFSYDRVILANVLHLEEAPVAASLLTRAGANLCPGGELITVDAFAHDELELRRSYDLYRLHLSMRSGGRVAHSERRIRDWYRDAGFKADALIRVDPKLPEMGVLVGQRGGWRG